MRGRRYGRDCEVCAGVSSSTRTGRTPRNTLIPRIYSQFHPQLFSSSASVHTLIEFGSSSHAERREKRRLCVAVHSRARGNDGYLSILSGHKSGSSARARKRLRGRSHFRGPRRFIRARGEGGQRRPMPNALEAVHPRARGGWRHSYGYTDIRQGSSARAGKRTQTFSSSTRAGGVDIRNSIAKQPSARFIARHGSSSITIHPCARVPDTVHPCAHEEGFSEGSSSSTLGEVTNTTNLRICRCSIHPHEEGGRVAAVPSTETVHPCATDSIGRDVSYVHAH